MLPEVPQEMRSRKNNSGHPDRVLARSSDAVLTVIVIRVGEIVFGTFCQEVSKHIPRHPQERDRASIYFLMTEDPEIIPGIYFLMT